MDRFLYFTFESLEVYALARFHMISNSIHHLEAFFQKPLTRLKARCKVHAMKPIHSIVKQH